MREFGEAPPLGSLRCGLGVIFIEYGMKTWREVPEEQQWAQARAALDSSGQDDCERVLVMFLHGEETESVVLRAFRAWPRAEPAWRPALHMPTWEAACRGGSPLLDTAPPSWWLAQRRKWACKPEGVPPG